MIRDIVINNMWNSLSIFTTYLGSLIKKKMKDFILVVSKARCYLSASLELLIYKLAFLRNKQIKENERKEIFEYKIKINFVDRSNFNFFTRRRKENSFALPISYD